MSDNSQGDLQLTEEQLDAIVGAGGCPTCNCKNCWGDRSLEKFARKRADVLIAQADNAAQAGKWDEAKNLLQGPVKRHVDLAEQISDRLAKRHKTS